MTTHIERYKKTGGSILIKIRTQRETFVPNMRKNPSMRAKNPTIVKTEIRMISVEESPPDEDDVLTSDITVSSSVPESDHGASGSL